MEADALPVARALPAPLCVITDRHRALHPLPVVLQSAVRAGLRWIRVREPDLELAAYASLCHVLIDAVDDARVTWSVRPSAYLLVRSVWPELRVAVHLTSEDAPWRATDGEMLIGRSVHADVLAAAQSNVRAAPIAHRSAVRHAVRHAVHTEQLDYQLLAPVFHTACKPDALPTGVPAVALLVNSTGTSVIALGGVTPHNIPDCLMAGASGVAVCGGVMESDTPDDMAAACLRALTDFTRTP